MKRTTDLFATDKLRNCWGRLRLAEKGQKTADFMKTALKRWSQVTTLHGARDIFAKDDYPSGIRIFWAMAMTVNLIAIAYWMFTLVFVDLKTASWPSAVTVERSENGQPYPTVTVCNFNRFRRSQAAGYNLSDALKRRIFHQLSNLTNIKSPLQASQDRMATTDQLLHWRLSYGQNMTLEQIFRLMGHQCSHMIRWVSIPAVSEEDLSADLCNANGVYLRYSETLSLDFGMCQTVQVNQNQLLIRSSGQSTGMTLILDAEIEEYSTDIFNEHLDEGFNINLAYHPDSMNVGSLNIPNGYHAWLALTAVHTRTRLNSFSLSDPPCALNHTLTIYTDKIYSKYACKMECMQKEILTKCGCLLMTLHENYRTCDFGDVERCEERGLIDVMNLSKSVNECKKSCKEACQLADATFTMTLTRFPAKNKIDALSRYINIKDSTYRNRTDWVQSMAAVHVYYDNMNVQVVERYERMTVNQILSTIGGHMGLWMGASILTLIQAVLFFILHCFNRRTSAYKVSSIEMTGFHTVLPR